MVNLMYYYLVRNATGEDRKKVDDELNRLAQLDVAEQRRREVQPKPPPKPAAPPTPQVAARRRRLPPQPAGWGNAGSLTRGRAAAKNLKTPPRRGA